MLESANNNKMWMTYATAAAVKQRVDILIWLTFKSIVCGCGNAVLFPIELLKTRKPTVKRSHWGCIYSQTYLSALRQQLRSTRCIKWSLFQILFKLWSSQMFKDIKCSYKGKQTNISESNMDTWVTLLFVFYCSTVIFGIYFENKKCNQDSSKRERD